MKTHDQLERQLCVAAINQRKLKGAPSKKKKKKSGHNHVIKCLISNGGNLWNGKTCDSYFTRFRDFFSVRKDALRGYKKNKWII